MRRTTGKTGNAASGLSSGLLAITVLIGATSFADEVSVRGGPGIAFLRPQLQVIGGSKKAAKKYYREDVSADLDFLTPETIIDSKLSSLLEYFGRGWLLVFLPSPRLAPAVLYQMLRSL